MTKCCTILLALRGFSTLKTVKIVCEMNGIEKKHD